MFDKYIDEFISSLEMKEFLKTPCHSFDTIADIIIYSPASIERKKRALKDLLEEIKFCDNQSLIEKCKIYLKSIEEALNLIEVDGVFSVEICSYNDRTGDSDYGFDGLYNNYNDLLKYIKNSINEWEIAEDEPLFFYVIKWINDESGKLIEACTYWIVRGEIWFAQIEDCISDAENIDVYMSVDLNLPVPFKAGDIVEVDLYPFADKRIIEILEVGDNWDCCCLQALSRSIDGKWNVGAVKHGHIGLNILPCVSPLYTMTLYKNELMPELKVLESISDYIDGKEKNGTKLWNALSDEDDITDEELLTIFEKVKVDDL